MIKAVIFDFGGVLLRTEDYTGRRQWEQKLGLAEWESEQIVFNSEMGHKGQHGEITVEELWAWVGDYLDLSEAELAAFRRDFWSGDVLDEALVALIRGLRPPHQTALISNACNDLRHVLTSEFGIADAFDLIVVSAEEGIMKPDPRIFEITLQRLGRQPKETVFIDDFAHNIAGARAVGMHAIHFTRDTDLQNELADLLGS
ncbi:MAG: HAD family phosphatase [Chloroflexi bacterium]|nr:HAD family phosphatase [Chloroflexota bacterium]